MIAVLLVASACTEADSSSEPLQGVVAYDRREVAFERPGRLSAVVVEAGDEVDEGALVATLDDEQVRLEQALAEAQHGVTEQQAELLRAGGRSEEVRAQRARLQAARAGWETANAEYNRTLALQESGAATPAQLDRSRGQRARAAGEVEALRHQLSAIRRGPREEQQEIAEAQVQASTMRLSLLARALRVHRAVAPMGGLVAEVHRRSGEMVMAGMPVVTMVDRRRPYADLFVPEQRVSSLSVGMRLAVRADGLETPLEGRVERMGHTLEYTPRFLFSERERPNLVLRVRVRVEDPERSLHAGVPVFVDWASIQPARPSQAQVPGQGADE